MPKKIRIFSSASDEDLIGLYRESRFAIFTSLAEGWGFPVAEALSFGKLCIASNAGAVPEIAGDLIPYFDPGNPAQAEELIARFATDDHALAEAEAKIRQNYKSRSWQSAAADLLQALRN